jgi:hypothetical protein
VLTVDEMGADGPLVIAHLRLADDRPVGNVWSIVYVGDDIIQG